MGEGWGVGGWGATPPKVGVGGGAAASPLKISATVTFKKWSKTSNFGSDQHGAPVNSSHVKRSSALTNIQNSYLVF